MFVETITSGRDEYELFSKGTRLTSDPPKALVVSVAWDAGDGRVSVLNVWESADAISDFYVERTRALIQEHGEPTTGKPERHGEPVEVYIRG